MKKIDRAMTTSRCPVVTEKATSPPAQQGVLRGREQRPPSRKSRTPSEKLFDVKVKSVNPLLRRARPKCSSVICFQSDVKRAIVTLEEATASDVPPGYRELIRRCH